MHRSLRPKLAIGTIVNRGNQQLENTYVPGSTVGATSPAVRRALLRAAVRRNSIVEVTYIVRYIGNTNTGGVAPVDGSSPYLEGSTVTVLGNTGTLTKSGYTFAEWNTAANGSGISYSSTNTITINSNITLYAQWTPIVTTTYTVSYDDNTSTGGVAPVDGSSPYLEGSTVTVLENTGSLTKTGYTFAGWNSAANGSGTSYSPTNTFTINNDITLFSQWTNLSTYTVSYDGNGNNSGVVPVDSSSPYLAGSTVTVPGNTGTLTRNNFIFNGWNTAANGSGTSYSPTNTFTINSNTILYTRWLRVYFVSYEDNGSTGGVVPVDVTPYVGGSTAIVLGNTQLLTKTGYVLIGWNTSANGTGTSYLPTNILIMNSSIRLYAQWALSYTVSYNGNVNTGGVVPVDTSSPYATGSTVTVRGNSGLLVKTGSSFTGWNTAADGSGTSYLPTNTFTIMGNTILYANWLFGVQTYTLIYNGNTKTSGNVPVDASSPYITGSSVTVRGNTGSPALAKTNFVYVGWNTAADYSGVTYKTGNIYTIYTNTVLYAIWGFTVEYNRNTSRGGAGSVAPAPTNSYAPNTAVAVLGNTYTNSIATRVFDGWNTTIVGTGFYYPPGSTLTVIYSNIILFAQWYDTADADLSVVYDGNGSTSGTPPATAYYKPYQKVPFAENTGSLTNNLLTFYGWNTNSAGYGISQPITRNGFTMLPYNTTLYAQWVDTAILCTLTYNANGGVGSVPPARTYYSGESVRIFQNLDILRTGHSFYGWNTAADGSGFTFSSNHVFVIKSNQTLYALWNTTNTLKSCSNTPGGSSDSSIYQNSNTRASIRDTTNNTLTTIIWTSFGTNSNGLYGFGDGPIASPFGPSYGNLISTYARAVISQVSGSYVINVTYNTLWSSGSQVQTATIPLSPTYWPTTQTMLTGSFSSTPETFTFDTSFNVASGCYGSVTSSTSGTVVNTVFAGIIVFNIIFNNGTTTRVAIGTVFKWETTTTVPRTYTYVSNYARVELANGLTATPFVPTSTTAINTL